MAVRSGVLLQRRDKLMMLCGNCPSALTVQLLRESRLSIAVVLSAKDVRRSTPLDLYDYGFFSLHRSQDDAKTCALKELRYSGWFVVDQKIEPLAQREDTSLTTQFSEPNGHAILLE